MTAAEPGIDWYAEVAADWAAQQHAEDEKGRIPEGGLFVTHCGRWVDGAGLACPQVISHSGLCGPTRTTRTAGADATALTASATARSPANARSTPPAASRRTG
ncbi:hypothetical protein GCM10010121_082530 [Streptomyces brasiliensis]|uniref:Uncharacterized protein n=1 Tax=Streptomyces brasiliensis TaxID=1954 RepID=A0A917LD35_9ACTN|nr:hypothetical protein GCM10010121_082530 [Streptomyces brasiliensis]